MKFFIYIVILIAHLFPAQLLGNNDTKPLVTLKSATALIR